MNVAQAKTLSWSVDDASRGKLVVRFYQALKDGKQKDEALRSAMPAVRVDGKHRNPSCWAAFQVIGDNQPVAAALVAH